MPLPSGRLIRGRGLRRPLGAALAPQFGLYLLGKPPAGPITWPLTWIRCPDFRSPSDPAAAGHAFADALDRASRERVEVGCGGGQGRTGTALACIAILDGVPAEDAVAYVRQHYRPRAVETPGQRRFVERGPWRPAAG